MMKRILIVNNNMHTGGVQRALVNLLKALGGVYEITLLLFYAGGELMRQVPDSVSVIEASALFRQWGMTRRDVKGMRSAAERGICALAARTMGRRWALKVPLALQKRLSGYDIAVSFLHAGDPYVLYGGCAEFVLSCTDAPRKVIFLHCDYGKIHADCDYNAGIYRRFDRIAACSEGCRRAFLEVLPSLAEKTVVVHNFLDYEQSRQKARPGAVTFARGRLNILTVARLSKEKGILQGIRAISALGEQKKKLRYYIIGDGSERSRAEALISALSLEDTVFLLGQKDNPYEYMAAADLLLIPSVSEAAPLVIGEAASLGTPILTTRTSSAEEMVERTKFGWVCENSCGGISRGLEALLAHPEKLAEVSAFLKNSHFSNETARRELEALLGTP